MNEKKIKRKPMLSEVDWSLHFVHIAFALAFIASIAVMVSEILSSLQ